MYFLSRPHECYLNVISPQLLLTQQEIVRAWISPFQNYRTSPENIALVLIIGQNAAD